MSFELYSLDRIYDITDPKKIVGSVTYNGHELVKCFEGCLVEPREIVDSEDTDNYWLEPLKYVYHFVTQCHFGFPQQLVAGEPSDILDVQLCRIKYNVIDIMNDLTEYRVTFMLTQMACLPPLMLQKFTGQTMFDYFVPMYEENKVRFVINEEVIDVPMNDDQKQVLRDLEVQLGNKLALTATNRDYIATLKNPFVLAEVNKKTSQKKKKDLKNKKYKERKNK